MILYNSKFIRQNRNINLIYVAINGARGEWECGREVGGGLGLATLPQTHCGSQFLRPAEASHSLCVQEPVVT